MPTELIIFIALICVGYVAGTLIEKRHYRSIEERERDWLGLPAAPLKQIVPDEDVARAWLVQGSVVVSIDYFKSVLSALQNLVGGGVGSYETLLDRARREAVLRMKEDAAGADMIVNARIETSSIGAKESNGRGVSGVEVLAYGTALQLKRRGHALHPETAAA